MKVHFKYPRVINAKVHLPGEHSLEDSLADHWYVKALIKSGDVSVMDEPPVKHVIPNKFAAPAHPEAALFAEAPVTKKSKKSPA